MTEDQKVTLPDGTKCVLLGVLNVNHFVVLKIDLELKMRHIVEDLHPPSMMAHRSNHATSILKRLGLLELDAKIKS